MALDTLLSRHPKYAEQEKHELASCISKRDCIAPFSSQKKEVERSKIKVMGQLHRKTKTRSRFGRNDANNITQSERLDSVLGVFPNARRRKNDEQSSSRNRFIRVSKQTVHPKISRYDPRKLDAPHKTGDQTGRVAQNQTRTHSKRFQGGLYHMVQHFVPSKMVST